MANDFPKVSVIIPTYKRSDMLCNAIDSVVNQTYPSIEVIVVDDNDSNSTWRAETKNKMKAYSMDDRVKYICHKRNKNGSAARNTGIKNSSGEYLCFLDDDDYYYPEKIKKQVTFICNNYVDACYCDYKKNGMTISVDENDDIARNILLGGATPQTSGWMISKKAVELLNGFDESYFRHQDYEFLLRFLREGLTIKKINEVLYERTVSTVDNRPSGEKTEEIKKKFFADFSDFIEDYSLKEKGFKNKLYVSAYASAFKGYYKSKDIKNCFRLIFKSFSCSVLETIFCYYRIIRSHM